MSARSLERVDRAFSIPLGKLLKRQDTISTRYLSSYIPIDLMLQSLEDKDCGIGLAIVIAAFVLSNIVTDLATSAFGK